MKSFLTLTLLFISTLIFVSCNTGESVKLKIKLNASYIGKFYLPGILAEAMYDGDIKAFQSGAWVEAVPQPRTVND